MTDATRWGLRATELANAGKYIEAERELREGLKWHPSHPVLMYGLATLLLARGEYAEGWKFYKGRFSLPGGPREPNFSFPSWNGNVVNRLLLLPEQGFGDQIMFARFVPHLAERIPNLTLLTPPPVVPIFQNLGADISAIDGTISVEKHDAWCYLGSLPQFFKTIPNSPYLGVNRAGRGIGVMLRGSGRDPKNTLPDSIYEKLKKLGTSLHPDDTGAGDFGKTAEIIANLELVVSIDTSVAHLSGAMGKPTILLLPHKSDWRWGRSEDHSIWYPSMKILRQRSPGDWDSIVHDLSNIIN